MLTVSMEQLTTRRSVQQELLMPCYYTTLAVLVVCSCCSGTSTTASTTRVYESATYNRSTVTSTKVASSVVPEEYDRTTGSQDGIYLNKWAVHIDGHVEDAEDIARQHGFVNKGQIGTLENYYLFEHHAVLKRSTDSSNHHTTLEQHPKVLWVEQQVTKRRVKRDYLPYLPMRDPLWDKQWYLHGGATGGYDMNIIPAWRKGYTGKGVVITILDDGIEHSHQDLKPNYDPDASWDINGQDPDPTPHYDGGDTNRHGTRCAGEVAAVANNTKCAVGAAFNAKIGGVRMLDGDVSDFVEAQSLSLKPQHVDIYSASWGPDDNGKLVDGPAKLAKEAFIQGILKGRGGKGSIFVWASGNGGSQYDSCNCDGYTNSLFTLSISSVSERGLKPWYLEECSSTLATTYSSGENYGDRKIVTTDLRGECTEAHTGTSASAPLAAAICALALEANPSLTWRDMQYVVMMTARPEPLLDGDWTVNGVGRKLSLKYGYGLMDASALVDLAAQWTTVPEQKICASEVSLLNTPIDSEGIQVSVDMDGCAGTDDSIRYLEHVQAKVSLRYSRRGDVQLHLVSPNKTRSLLLQKRKIDYQEGEFRQWPFMSVHFWGEDPRGLWTLEVDNVGSSLNTGTFIQWQLILYGVNTDPINLKPIPVKPTQNQPTLATMTTVTSANTTQANPPTPPPAKNADNAAEKAEKEQHLDESWNTDVEPGIKDGRPSPIDKNLNNVDGEGPGGKVTNGGGINKHPAEEGLEKQTSSASRPDGSKVGKADTMVKTENESWLPIKDWGANSKRILCHNECQTDLGCRGPEAKDCHTCRHARLQKGGPCVEECPILTYHNTDTALCEPCSKYCERCSGPDQTDCVSCPEDHYLLNTNHTCLSECPLGYLQVDGACEPCELPCVSCLEDTSHCLTCEPDWELVDNTCHPPCSMYHYRHADRCNPCISNCQVCIGPEGEDCVACGHGHLLYNHTCVVSCGDGYYPTTTNHGGECLRCHESCLKCNGGGEGECIECTTPLTLHHNQCLLLCKQGEYKTNGDKCLPCDASCLNCSGESGYDCLSCPNLNYLHNGECVSTCPEGHFPTGTDVTGRVCAECLPPCAECEDSPSHCTMCLLGQTLEGNACILHCGVSEFLGREGCVTCHSSCRSCSGPGPSECTSCPQDNHLHEASCIPDCPNSTYGSAGQCHPCHQSCATCKGGDENNCLSCSEGKVLVDSACIVPPSVPSTSPVMTLLSTTISNCPNGAFLNTTTKECAPCDVTCTTCSGWGPYRCLTCTAPRRFYSKLSKLYSCVLCCSDAVSHSCCSCHPKTGVCMENRNIDYDNIPGAQEQAGHDVVPIQKKMEPPTQPCIITSRHPQQSGIVSLVAVFSVFSFIVFLAVFSILQARSNKRLCWYRHYQPVPMYYQDGSERVTLSKGDLQDEDSVSSA